VEKIFPTQPYPASLSICPENQFPAMDASYSVLLHALRKMELRIREVLDGRGALRATWYATGRTGVFDREPCCVAIDEEPDSDEMELIPDQAVVLGANPAPPATAVDTPFTCSPKCLRKCAQIS
jgi:hypothetical protein